MLREDLQNLSAVPQFSQYRSLYFYKGCVEQRKCDQYEFEKENLSEARKNAYYDTLSKIQGFEKPQRRQPLHDALYNESRCIFGANKKISLYLVSQRNYIFQTNSPHKSQIGRST